VAAQTVAQGGCFAECVVAVDIVNRLF